MKASAASAASARKPAPPTKGGKTSAQASSAKKMPSSGTSKAAAKPAAKAPAKPVHSSAKAHAPSKPASARRPSEAKTVVQPAGQKPAASAAGLAAKVAPSVKAPAEKPQVSVSLPPTPKPKQDPVAAGEKPDAGREVESVAPAPKPKQDPVAPGDKPDVGREVASVAPAPKPKQDPVAPAPQLAEIKPVAAALAESEKAPAPVPPPELVRRPAIPERVVAIRPPAKAETFAEGDHVVYPTHGVGKVERIVVEEIAGHQLELIHITFEENRMTLRVPVTKARSAGLRKLATRKMFDEALGILKGRARVKRTMWSRRAQEYEAKINSGDPLAIAEVVRDLHRNAGQPDQSFSERQIYEAAMDRLAAELAALDQTDKATAATKLADFLKTV